MPRRMSGPRPDRAMTATESRFMWSASSGMEYHWKKHKPALMWSRLESGKFVPFAQLQAFPFASSSFDNNWLLQFAPQFWPSLVQVSFCYSLLMRMSPILLWYRCPSGNANWQFVRRSAQLARLQFLPRLRGVERAAPVASPLVQNGR